MKIEVHESIRCMKTEEVHEGRKGALKRMAMKGQESRKLPMHTKCQGKLILNIQLSQRRKNTFLIFWKTRYGNLFQSTKTELKLESIL